MSTKSKFLNVVSDCVRDFAKNRICVAVNEGRVTMDHYHQILLMIFHQTYEGPATFSLAAAHTPLKMSAVRDYLQQHADEEKTHWQWVIEDLKNTGYTGTDPRESFPKTACQAYVAYNVYTAIRTPVARAVLESIGASHGKQYATRVCQILKLKPEQAQFFYGHGDTDVGHTREIINLLGSLDLTESDWELMIHAAKTAGRLYTNMYNEALEETI